MIPSEGNLERAEKHKFPIDIFVQYPVLKGKPKQFVIGTKKSDGKLEMVLNRIIDQQDFRVTVPTIHEDGYLTAEVNVLLAWTLLVPEEMASVIISTPVIASVSVIGILAISIFYFKKKR